MMTTVAAGAGAASLILTVVPATKRKILDELHKYTDIDVKDLTLIGEHYIRHGGLNSEFNEETSEESDSLPILLQLSTEKSKFPQIYVNSEAKFAPCKESNRWIESLGEGHLSNAIEESLNYICEYQRERDQAILKREFAYDPINLFLEELKNWLHQLSKKPLDTDALPEKIVQRISYLKHIKNDQRLFEPQKQEKLSSIDNSCNIRATLVDLINILNKKILPTIRDILSRQSAREQFDKLRLNIKNSIKNLFKFTFYVLRDNETSPNFLLEELRQPTFSTYKKNHSYVLESILRHLATSAAVINVIPTIRTEFSRSEKELAASSTDLIHYNEFTTNDGSSNLPQLANFPQLTRTNFWNPDQKEIETGILPAFRTQPIMDTFLELCGYIQKLCLCYAIADDFFELAGEGGNILVYRLAADQVEPLLDQFSNLFDTVIDKNKRLMDCAEQHYNSHTAKRNKKTHISKQDGIWIKQYSTTDQAYETCQKNLTACKHSLAKISQKLKAVNSPQYIQNLKDKVSHLMTLLKCFRSMDTIPGANLLLNESNGTPTFQQSATSSSSYSLFSCNEMKNQVLTTSAITLPENQRNAIEQFVSEKKYDEAIEAYHLSTLKYPDDLSLKLKFANFLLKFQGIRNKIFALDLVEEVLSCDSDNITANYLAAVINERLGELEDAKSYLIKLLAIEPDNKNAKLRYEKIMFRLAEINANYSLNN